eukprot:2656668-Rhodomonas_salina.2
MMIQCPGASENSPMQVTECAYLLWHLRTRLGVRSEVLRVTAHPATASGRAAPSWLLSDGPSVSRSVLLGQLLVAGRG